MLWCTRPAREYLGVNRNGRPSQDPVRNGTPSPEPPGLRSQPSSSQKISRALRSQWENMDFSGVSGVNPTSRAPLEHKPVLLMSCLLHLVAVVEPPSSSCLGTLKSWWRIPVSTLFKWLSGASRFLFLPNCLLQALSTFSSSQVLRIPRPHYHNFHHKKHSEMHQLILWSAHLPHHTPFSQWCFWTPGFISSPSHHHNDQHFVHVEAMEMSSR